MEYFLILIYGIAFIAIIYYMIQLKPMNSSLDKLDTATSAFTEETQTAWPWSITSYSFWPSWMKSHETANIDGYGYDGHGMIAGHASGYGYTGRQKSTDTCSFEGDGLHFDGLRGSYSGGGYGFTGREKPVMYKKHT